MVDFTVDRAIAPTNIMEDVAQIVSNTIKNRNPPIHFKTHQVSDINIVCVVTVDGSLCQLSLIKLRILKLYLGSIHLTFFRSQNIFLRFVAQRTFFSSRHYFFLQKQFFKA